MRNAEINAQRLPRRTRNRTLSRCWNTVRTNENTRAPQIIYTCIYIYTYVYTCTCIGHSGRQLLFVKLRGELASPTSKNQMMRNTIVHAMALRTAHGTMMQKLSAIAGIMVVSRIYMLCMPFAEFPTSKNHLRSLPKNSRFRISYFAFKISRF